MSIESLRRGRDAAQLVRLSPWYAPPFDASPVDKTSPTFASIAPVDMTTGEATTGLVLEYVVPARYVLRVASLGVGAVSTAALGLLTWSVKIDGNEVPGYHFIPVATGSIDAPASVDILVEPERTLQVYATNNSEAVARVVARFAGWLFDPTEGGRL